MERCAAAARRAFIAALTGTAASPLAAAAAAPAPLAAATAPLAAATTPLAAAATGPLAHTGQILSAHPPLHRDLVAGSPDETLQLVAAQRTHTQAPALLCPGCTTTRDARAARNPNPESSR